MVNVGVDADNYDSSGNTALLDFVVHLLDGEDHKTLMTSSSFS